VTPVGRRLAVGVSVFLATLGVGALVFEGLLRIFSENRYVNDNTYIQFVRIRPPGTDYVVNRRFLDPERPQVRFRTDARSYHLPEPRFDESAPSITFFGASTTECGAVQEELRFPALVSVLLEERGYRVNSRSIARADSSVQDALNVLLNHAVADQPDYAVLMSSGADIASLRIDAAYGTRMARPLSWGIVLTWLKQRLSSASWLVAQLRYALATWGSRNALPRLENLRHFQPGFPDAAYRTRLKAFIALCRAFDIEPILMTEAYARFGAPPGAEDDSAFHQANQAVRDVGAAEGVLVIDLMQRVREAVPDYDEPMNLFYDGVHLTDRGSQVYAEQIADAFASEVLPGDPAARRPGS
jgi:lysophospholipase L1-like esterase